VIGGGLAILIAIIFDALLFWIQRITTPWRRAVPS